MINNMLKQDVITNADCTSRDELISKFEFMQGLPGFIFAKDLNSEFVGMSGSFSKILGWKNVDRALGTSDYETPCKVSEYADRFIAEDLQVFNSDTNILNLEIYECAAGWKSLIIKKLPFKNKDGRIVATFCQALDVSNIKIFIGFQSLSYADNKIIYKPEPSTYILNSEHCPLPLSTRQQECLFWLIRGKTMKEIAYLLNLSERTIEAYIDNIKYKLGCYTKGQIIEKAIDAGFLYYIPERFLNIKL
jgi:DNA-binding CsgD family transcriptional regulator